MSAYSVISLFGAVAFSWFTLGIKTGRYGVDGFLGMKEALQKDNKPAREFAFKYFLLVVLYYIICSVVLSIVSASERIGLIMIAAPFMTNHFILKPRIASIYEQIGDNAEEINDEDRNR